MNLTRHYWFPTKRSSNQIESSLDGRQPHPAAPDVPEPAFAMQRLAASPGDRDVHQPDRLRRCCPTRPCNACDRRRDIGPGTRQGAFRHRPRDILTDCADALDQRRIDAQAFSFG